MELTAIKGVSDKRAADFKKAGVEKAEDLPRFFPRNYLDLTHVLPLEKCYHNDVVLTYGRVTTAPRTFTSARKLRCVRACVEQGMRSFTVIWFNAPYVLGQLRAGEEYLFYGRVQSKFGGLSLVNPSFEPMDRNVRLKGIVPVYPARGCLTQKCVRDAVSFALNRFPPQEVIPGYLVRKYGLSSLADAYREIHQPTDLASAALAAERVATEEYFTLISAFKCIKGDRQQVRVNSYGCAAADLKAFSERFGFPFTDGQKKAVNEIYSDMTGPRSMNRLVQGDVGSGKTAVALCAVYVAVKSGYQAVVLAPTEILAEQNFAVVKRIFPEYECVFLSGSLPAKEKRTVKAAISSGEARIVVGTHAVLTGDVSFYNLSLCVCDEQHRFGVGQRSALVAKGIVPDVLVMSATPIPRTLSLIFYGDLDVTEITDKPKNRLPVQTNIVPERKYDGMLGFIADTVAAGRQAFCVCPKIEGDDEGTVMSVTELFEELKERLPSVRVALLHGKMKEAQKAEIMGNFKRGQTDLLVSTTVIEVGIDVPNATVMVVYNAERFGLSQLHQLRGRVGRGGEKSYCFLYTATDDEKALERLRVLCESNDGFRIAEKDFEMRGSGDFLGTRQSGRFVSDIGGIGFSPSVVFFAKKLCDEAFSRTENLPDLRARAMEKYEKLKDVALN
ncbi:MAG: ATP-dependent DNA helicase RecG [Candidatus Borkfalkiaceae bacterium]|nr:ATP-dependent DNA helicase RecG [Christensenellaceae bacterium]